jgi:hypothetical protein
MERFLKRHQGRFVGILSGFDRFVLRGTLQSICHVEGMARFLGSQKVLLKDFKSYVRGFSQAIIQQAERIRERSGRPYIALEGSRESKEDIARQITLQERIDRGLICIIGSVERCQAFDVRSGGRKGWLHLVKRERRCLHLYFYFMDRDYGLMHVRLQTWFPFTIQVCINGREYLARQMDRRGIHYQRLDNCFAYIDQLEKAQALMDRFEDRNWVDFLNRLAGRVNPWLGEKNEVTFGPYYWTIWEEEYALDLIARNRKALQQIYHGLVDHAIRHFGSKDVLRFLGRRSVHGKGEVRTQRLERADGVRVKHWVQENSIKMYDKFGVVLRIEVTINNPRRFSVRRRVTRKGIRKVRWVPMRRGIADLYRRVEVSRAAIERYLEALAIIVDLQPRSQLIDAVGKPIQSGKQKFRPLHPVSAEDSELFRVFMAGEFKIQGVRNADIRSRLYADTLEDPLQNKKMSGRVTRKLGLLRAHKLVYKVSGTNYYRPTRTGIEIMANAIAIRDNKIAA